MPDSNARQIQPVPRVGGTAVVQPVRRDAHVAPPDPHRAAPRGHEVAAITGGGLPRAYAQITVNPDTRDMVIEIRDSVTDQVIRQYPSREIEAMNRYMQQYADTVARRQAAKPHDGSVG